MKSNDWLSKDFEGMEELELWMGGICIKIPGHLITKAALTGYKNMAVLVRGCGDCEKHYTTDIQNLSGTCPACGGNNTIDMGGSSPRGLEIFELELKLEVNKFVIHKKSMPEEIENEIKYEPPEGA